MDIVDFEGMMIEHACARLQSLYCYYADHRMIEEFVGLFTEDASMQVPGASFSGHREIHNSINTLCALPLEFRHIASNSIIDPVDEQHANGSCYLLVFNSSAKPNEMNMRPTDIPSTVGEYKDTFLRTSKGWRIASRQLIRIFRNPADPLLTLMDSHKNSTNDGG